MPINPSSVTFARSSPNLCTAHTPVRGRVLFHLNYIFRFDICYQNTFICKLRVTIITIWSKYCNMQTDVSYLCDTKFRNMNTMPPSPTRISQDKHKQSAYELSISIRNGSLNKDNICTVTYKLTYLWCSSDYK